MRRALLVFVAACGVDPSGNDFALLTSDERIELLAPTDLLVQVVVVGADGEDVAITSPNMPGFATLTGSTVRLQPQYADAGDYDIELVATTPSHSATGHLRIAVDYTNTGPMWLASPWFNSGAPAWLMAPVCDLEGNNFSLEVDVAREVDGQFTFDQVPDYTVDVDFAVTPPLSYEPMPCVDIRLNLDGLVPGSYQGALHAVDVLGAEDPYGWVPFQAFAVTGP